MNFTVRDFYLKAFAQDSFLSVNKKLLQKLGPRKAIFISNLIDKCAYFENNHPENDGWFFLIHEQQIIQTGMSEKIIRAIKKGFSEIGVLKLELRGAPPKEWYWIDFERLDEIVEIVNEKNSPNLTKREGLKITKREGLIYKETKYKETKEYTSYMNAVPSETVSSLPLPKRNRPAPELISPPKEKNAVLRSSPCGQFICAWNKAPGPHTKHSLVGSSKTLLRIKRYYNQLRGGIFFQDKKWNPDWLKRNPKVAETIYLCENPKINPKNFSENDLLEILNSAMQHFLEGYWPQDKKTIPRSLADFIYNPHNQNSWFIKAMADPPRLLRKPGLPAEQEYDPQSTNLFLELMGENRNNDRAVRKINHFVKKMKECYELTVETYPPGGSGSGTNFHYEYPDWGMFVEAYGHWLEEQNWVNSIDLSSFRMGGGLVQHWFQELRQQFDYGDEDFKILRG